MRQTANGTDAADPIIGAIYRGAMHEAGWEHFLEQTCLRLDATYASVSLGAGGAARREFFLPALRGSRLAEKASAGARLASELGLPYRSMTPDVPHRLADILPRGLGRRGDYLRYLKGRQMSYPCVMRLDRGGGESAFLTLARDTGEFEPWVEPVLRRLAPHLASAIDLFTERERERTQAQAGGAALARLGLGWMAFDRAGRVLEIDARAQAAVARIGRPGAWRPGHRPPLEERHRLGLQAALDGFATGSGEGAVTIRLGAAGQPHLVLVPAPAASGALAIGYVEAEGAPRAGLPAALAQIHGLTAREAQLAAALAEGMTIAQAATRVGLALETARTYSKRIYAKTGTRGQTELVRLLGRGILAIC